MTRPELKSDEWTKDDIDPKFFYRECIDCYRIILLPVALLYNRNEYTRFITAWEYDPDWATTYICPICNGKSFSIEENIDKRKKYADTHL